MSKTRRLLLADNSSDYRRSVRGVLELHDYEVEEASSVEDAMPLLEKLTVDLVLADLRLTDDADEYDISGLRLARIAAEKGIPCLIMTAYPSVDTIRLALRAVTVQPLAVDYIPKTAGPQALLAAVESVFMRHAAGATRAGADLVVDLEQRLAWYKGVQLTLSRNQYALLAHLYQNAGAVCGPDELLNAVYHEDVTPEQAISDKRLERMVERLRRKIEDDPRQPHHLIKEPRRGYRLVLKP